MNTRQALLDQAALLIRTRGYNGFSYADLAERVGIRKASIHHHFPTKEDLGLALVERYIDHFAHALNDIDRQQPSPQAALQAYIALYRQSASQSWGCLCGMLASDIDVIPPSVALGVRRFMTVNLDWLDAVIARQASPTQSAQTVLALCQGALLTARSMQSLEYFDHALSPLMKAVESG